MIVDSVGDEESGNGNQALSGERGGLVCSFRRIERTNAGRTLGDNLWIMTRKGNIHTVFLLFD